MFGKRPGRAGIVGGRTLIQRAIAVLRRFGTNAHIYLPGVGMLNGLTAANYLDSAGTTQGTVDQPVGLVLDAAGSLGVDVVVNGASWSVPAGVSETGGVITFTSPAAFSSTFQIGNAVIGTTYKVVYEISSYVSGSIKALCGATGGTTRSANGTYEEFLIAGATTSAKQLQVQGSFVGVAKMLSVREVTGIAASQPTTASKPILRRGAVNLLTYSGDFSNAAWTLQNGATLSGSTVTLSADGQSIYHSTTGIPAAPQTFAAVLSGSGTCTLYGYNGVDSGGGLLGLIQVTLSATPTLFRTYFPATTTTSWAIGRRSGDTATSVTIAATGVFSGNITATQIQALGGIPLTTTAPASTALGSMYWQFDGSNDSLSLGGPLFQASDDHYAGVAVAQEAGTGTVAALSVANPTTAATALMLGYTGTPSLPSVYYYDDAGVLAIVIGTNSPYGTKRVLSSRKSGVAKSLFVDGVFVGVSNTALGATLVNNSTIGATSTGSFLNGGLSASITIKGSVSPADALLLDKLLANFQGRTL